MLNLAEVSNDPIKLARAVMPSRAWPIGNRGHGASPRESSQTGEGDDVTYGLDDHFADWDYLYGKGSRLYLR